MLIALNSTIYEVTPDLSPKTQNKFGGHDINNLISKLY